MVHGKIHHRTENQPSSPFAIKMLTVAEVAARLKVETSRVDHWLKVGAVPCFDFDGDLRVSEQDLAVFAMAHRVLRSDLDISIDASFSKAPSKTSASRLITIREATQILGIGRSTLYSMITRGELSTVRIGRRRMVSSETLEHFVAGLQG